MNLPDTLGQQIAALGRRYGAKKIVLFGSRARGDNLPQSDVDLAVYGMAKENQPAFSTALEELQTLLSFDVVHMEEATSPALTQNIEKDGVLLMGLPYFDKLTSFEKAISRLKEAIAEYTQTGSTVARDGVIQRFEFTCELSWKVTREFLLDQGYTEINSPKSTMRQAFSFGLIQDDGQWLALLGDRNLTSHLYDEAAAGQIYARIADSYVLCFEQLLEQLKRY